MRTFNRNHDLTKKYSKAGIIFHMIRFLQLVSLALSGSITTLLVALYERMAALLNESGERETSETVLTIVSTLKYHKLKYISREAFICALYRVKRCMENFWREFAVTHRQEMLLPSLPAPGVRRGNSPLAPILSTLDLLVDSSLESSRSLWSPSALAGHTLAMPFSHPHQAQQGSLPDWIASICIQGAGARMDRVEWGRTGRGAQATPPSGVHCWNEMRL